MQIIAYSGIDPCLVCYAAHCLIKVTSSCLLGVSHGLHCTVLRCLTFRGLGNHVILNEEKIDVFKRNALKVYKVSLVIINQAIGRRGSQRSRYYSQSYKKY
jgi:hypothetical protein